MELPHKQGKGKTSSFFCAGIKPKEGINHQMYIQALFTLLEFWERFSLCSPEWHQTELLLPSASRVLTSQACIHHAWLETAYENTWHNGSTRDSKRLCGMTSCVPHAEVWECKTAKTATLWFTYEHLLLRPRTLKSLVLVMERGNPRPHWELLYRIFPQLHGHPDSRISLSFLHTKLSLHIHFCLTPEKP